MDRKMMCAAAALIAATLGGCATKNDLTREEQVEKLRIAAERADRERDHRQLAQAQHMAKEAALDRAAKKPL